MNRCLSEEDLAALVEGKVTESERWAYESHLAHCPSCREEALGIKRTLDAASAERIPDGLEGRIAEKVGKHIIAPLPDCEKKSFKEGMSMSMRYTALIAASLLLVSILALLVFSPQVSQQPQSTPKIVYLPREGGDAPKVIAVSAPPPPRDFGGENRHLAYLSTDKPVYRPGEQVFGRAVLLNAHTRKPVDQQIWTMFEVRSARGEVVAQSQSTAEQSIAPFNWQIPEELAGGLYTLRAIPGNGYPPAEMTFDIRSYHVPRMKTDLQFIKKAYGPGEEVSAMLSALRAEGGIPTGANVTAIATVDGVEVYRGKLTLNDQGIVGVNFKLPNIINVGDGTLALVIQDGGIQESAAKTIPIVINRVALDLYPEGGDLIGGVENRVYFEAQTPRKDPADVTGRIVDESGKEVARFESLHEGKGKFSFTPKLGSTYRAVLDKPAAIRDSFPLPNVANDGISLVALDETFASDKPVRVRLASNKTTGVTVGLYLRERELERIVTALEAGRATEIAFSSTNQTDGVLRVTVFDSEGRPRAERLVFRRPANELRIAVQVDAPQNVPAGNVNVTIRATDRSGKPVSAVVGLSAVDDAVLSIPDKRDRAPRLPTQALLGSEVRELKDPGAYLSNDPQASAKVDLLLGTQGWRRFVFVKPAELVALNDLTKYIMADYRNPWSPMEPKTVQWGILEEGVKIDNGANEIRKFRAGKVMAALPSPKPAAPEKEKKKADMEFQREGNDLMGKEVGNRGKRELIDEIMKQGWTRVYAHAALQDRPKEERNDFAETVYWNAGIATDNEGVAKFSFQLSDSITTVRILADGFSRDGALGEADGTVEVRRPFYIEPRMPIEITRGDRVDLPISLVNGTGERMDVQLEATTDKGMSDSSGPWKWSVQANGSDRTYLSLKGEPHQGESQIKIKARAGDHVDEVARTVTVVPSGFPIEINAGGLLEVKERFTVAIPQEVEPGSLTAQAAVYPSPLASLTQALSALLREPSGCFEQTSSTTYPTVMALRYMKSHSGVDPELVKRASDLVEKGYKRLTSFECSNKGYEWFGGNPGHEALSAYGLLEFSDMADVYQVDATMLDRTRQWILARRDGKGGFLRDPKALDSFGGAPEDITNAYIVWSLTEAGEKGLEKEIAAVRERAVKSEDPYFLALVANILIASGDRPAAEGILARLAGKQDKEGSLQGAKTSITRSGGESLTIETTSLAILAWLKSPKHTANVEKGMQWLLERCKGGRFGSTQATVLALRAIIAYDAVRARPKGPGTLKLVVDGKMVASESFGAGREGPIELTNISATFTPGKHEVELIMDGGANMPYSFQVRYHSPTPASSERCKVAVAASLSKAQVAEGEPIDVRVELRNVTKEGLPMAVAIVGLPGGLEARADQLKELVRAGRVDAFETRGREVILYWRSVAPEAKQTLTISCLAAVPGEYTGPASRAYLYYTDEEKCWVKGLSVKVDRR